MQLWMLFACTAEPRHPTAEDVLAQTLPTVVLVVGRHQDGSLGYGAGIIRDDGAILTNDHVVAGADSVSVLTYDPTRPSYSPLDGGLDRYLFENERDLVEAHVGRHDPVLDLAVLQAEVEAAPELELRTEPLALGTTVFALGHPKESPWSFSAGVVSALHNGLVQHDAPINAGSSGGPLVDALGRWVGVNSTKLHGGAEGMAFARPADLAEAFLHEDFAAFAIAEGNVRDTAMACERAIEVAPISALACFDWEANARFLVQVAERAAELASLPPDLHATFVGFARGEGRAHWMAFLRARVLAHLSAQDSVAEPNITALSRDLLVPTDLWTDPRTRENHVSDPRVLARYARAVSDLGPLLERREVRLELENHMARDLVRDSQAYQEARKRGLRVDAVLPVPGIGAWIRVAGRNGDGTPWSYSECWNDVEGRWLQPLSCSPQHLEALPTDWPPPVLVDTEILEPMAVRVSGTLLGIDDPKGWAEQVVAGSKKPTPAGQPTAGGKPTSDTPDRRPSARPVH